MTFSLSGKRTEARLECTNVTHKRDQATEDVDKHHDVDHFDGTLHHRNRDIPDLSRAFTKRFVGTRDGNRLIDSTCGELGNVDVNAQLLQAFLGGRNGVFVALWVLDHKGLR